MVGEDVKSDSTTVAVFRGPAARHRLREGVRGAAKAGGHERMLAGLPTADGRCASTMHCRSSSLMFLTNHSCLDPMER